MSFLDPVLNPLLQLPLLWVIIILSFALSLLVTIIYKLVTDQNLMKQLKDELKEFQKEMKELKSHPEKMMEVQKKAMQTNMRYMMLSMKSTLITFIPLIIIFGWMSSHLAYEPIKPGQEFSVSLNFEPGTAKQATIEAPEGITLLSNATKGIENGRAIWVMKGNEGEYLLQFDYDGRTEQKDIVITYKQEYREPIKKVKGSNLKFIEVEQKKVIVLNLFGWKLGWIGTYIIFSIIFSMLLRKVMKVY